VIKVNLLAAERKAAKVATGGGGGKSFSVPTGNKVTVGCSLILITTLAFLGWRFWTLQLESRQLDQDIASAQQETARLHSIIQQVQQFEQRRAQLQQRVALIEDLRRSQTGPVHMLDQVSRSLPDMLWLTSLKQVPESQEVLIDGRAISPTTVSDFVANLEATGYFKRSVEIVSTTVETIKEAPGELIRFQVRALFQPPGSAPPLPNDAAAAAATKRAN
jgi:type IV pilus assembly protein PilN